MIHWHWRNSRMTLRHRFMWYAGALLSAGMIWACGGDDDTTAPQLSPEIESLRASLAPFTSLGRAKADGYNVALTDCMSNGDIGAMGVHWGNGALIDGSVEQLHP